MTNPPEKDLRDALAELPKDATSEEIATAILDSIWPQGGLPV